MKKLDRILIGLELNESDLSLIKYASDLVSVLFPAQVDFIHIAENFISPSPELDNFTPRDEKIEEEMKAEVSKHFGTKACEVHFEVVEGNPSEQLLHWAAVKKSDLILLGRKTSKKHAEITLEKIVRKAPCSVMIIPENATFDIDKVLFPVDYSPKSAEGLKQLNNLFHSPKIEGLHFFELPSGYYKTGKTEEEFIAILDNNAKKEAEQLIADFADSSNLSFKNICSDQIDEFEYILDYAKANSYGIIAIGSRGRTNAASLLLGSFAEKFIRYNRTLPSLIMKEKGENMSLLKAFLKF